MEYCRYKQKVKKNKHGEDLKKIRSYLLNTGVLIATDQELTLAWYEFSDDLCDSGWMDVSDELLHSPNGWKAMLTPAQRKMKVPTEHVSKGSWSGIGNILCRMFTTSHWNRKNQRHCCILWSSTKLVLKSQKVVLMISLPISKEI